MLRWDTLTIMTLRIPADDESNSMNTLVFKLQVVAGENKADPDGFTSGTSAASTVLDLRVVCVCVCLRGVGAVLSRPVLNVWLDVVVVLVLCQSTRASLSGNLLAAKRTPSSTILFALFMTTSSLRASSRGKSLVWRHTPPRASARSTQSGRRWAQHRTDCFQSSWWGKKWRAPRHTSWWRSAPWACSTSKTSGGMWPCPYGHAIAPCAGSVCAAPRAMASRGRTW